MNIKKSLSVYSIVNMNFPTGNCSLLFYKIVSQYHPIKIAEQFGIVGLPSQITATGPGKRPQIPDVNEWTLVKAIGSTVQPLRPLFQ